MAPDGKTDDSPIRFELAACEATPLAEIAVSASKRLDVAKTYALALRSSEARTINWRRVNEDIIARWSLHALNWIKEQAHSGKCFA